MPNLLVEKMMTHWNSDKSLKDADALKEYRCDGGDILGKLIMYLLMWLQVEVRIVWLISRNEGL